MKNSRMTRGDKGALAAVVAACAVCCPGPLIGVLAAIGVTSALAAFALPGLALLTVAAGGGIWWLNRRFRAHCGTPMEVVNLAMPTVRPAEVGRDDATVATATNPAPRRGR